MYLSYFQDLQKYLDEAKDGVIFFSLGSNLRSDQLGADKIKVLLDAFKQLPQRILWKWESDTLPGKPENVKLGKWLPQNDILAHPNLRLFITHGGMMSTQEAVYHGVPIVGIPFFADQHINIHKAVVRGVGENLPFTTLSVDSVLKAIRKILSAPRYV
jgi:glucuronosyltransferase